MRNQYLVRISTLVALATFALMTACSLSPQSGVALNGTAGVKTYREVNQSLSIQTGIPLTNSTVSNFYNKTQTRMSTDGNATKVTYASLLAHTSLTGVYCAQLVAAEQALPATQRKVLGLVDFNETNQLMTDDIRRNVVQGYAHMFWRRDANDYELNEMLAAMASAEQGVTPSKTQAVNLLKMACTAIGSTADSVTN
jgi:hypothetical protein